MQRSETIQAGGATTAAIHLEMAVGDLRVSGGASDLAEADFTYDEDLAPRIGYLVENNQGMLNIEQQSKGNVRATRNEWDIRLNDDLPVDLRTSVAAAGATFDLDALRMSLFDVHSASGSVTASLAGQQPDLGHVDLVSASGRIVLLMNGSYGALTTMHAKSASGQVDLTLGSDWQDDLDCRIESVSGEVIVRVPLDIGVIIGPSTISGRINTDDAPNFRSRGRAIVNEALETSRIKLQLRLSTISGGITIVEAD